TGRPLSLRAGERLRSGRGERALPGRGGREAAGPETGDGGGPGGAVRGGGDMRHRSHHAAAGPPHGRNRRSAARLARHVREAHGAHGASLQTDARRRPPERSGTLRRRELPARSGQPACPRPPRCGLHRQSATDDSPHPRRRRPHAHLHLAPPEARQRAAAGCGRPLRRHHGVLPRTRRVGIRPDASAREDSQESDGREEGSGQGRIARRGLRALAEAHAGRVQSHGRGRRLRHHPLRERR
ncbi:uncharacterized protein METZ01_LOCUS484955, partial [marine metagenome]